MPDSFHQLFPEKTDQKYNGIFSWTITHSSTRFHGNPFRSFCARGKKPLTLGRGKYLFLGNSQREIQKKKPMKNSKWLKENEMLLLQQTSAVWLSGSLLLSHFSRSPFYVTERHRGGTVVQWLAPARGLRVSLSSTRYIFWPSVLNQAAQMFSSLYTFPVTHPFLILPGHHVALLDVALNLGLGVHGNPDALPKWGCWLGFRLWQWSCRNVPQQHVAGSRRRACEDEKQPWLSHISSVDITPAHAAPRAPTGQVLAPLLHRPCSGTTAEGSERGAGLSAGHPARERGGGGELGSVCGGGGRRSGVRGRDPGEPRGHQGGTQEVSGGAGEGWGRSGEAAGGRRVGLPGWDAEVSAGNETCLCRASWS